MRVIILVSAVCMQFVWSHGAPANSKGVGAYAYQDSTGNRYGGTYDLEDGKVVNYKGSPGGVPDSLVPGKFVPGDVTGNFVPENFVPFQFEFPDFFPEHFRNLQSLWQEFRRGMYMRRRGFRRNVKGFDDQELGLRTGESDNPEISRFAGFGGFGGPGYGMNFRHFNMPGMGMQGMGMGMPPMGMPGMDMPRQSMPMMGPNSAFAGAAAGPGYVQHQDFISPSNPNMPNVNVMKYTQPNPSGFGDYVSVSSNSYSSSSNIGGKEYNTRGSETMVNNNGDVTSYSVHN